MILKAYLTPGTPLGSRATPPGGSRWPRGGAKMPPDERISQKAPGLPPGAPGHRPRLRHGSGGYLGLFGNLEECTGGAARHVYAQR